MFFVSPTAGERFHLRTLLTVVKGPTSFENLRTINGIEFPTFRDACIHLGLLEDDGGMAAVSIGGRNNADRDTTTRIVCNNALILQSCAAGGSLGRVPRMGFVMISTDGCRQWG